MVSVPLDGDSLEVLSELEKKKKKRWCLSLARRRGIVGKYLSGEGRHWGDQRVGHQVHHRQWCPMVRGPHAVPSAAPEPQAQAYQPTVLSFSHF